MSAKACTNNNTSNIKCARILAGLTQKACGERFGYTLRGWQNKESKGKEARALSQGEFELLLLLANVHPSFILAKKEKLCTQDSSL